MRAAPQDDSFRIVQVRAGEPVQVIELEEARLLAPVPALVGKGAASAVAAVDLALQSSLLDFRQMNEEVRLDDAAAPEDFASGGEELYITKGTDSRIGVDHFRFLPSNFEASPEPGRASEMPTSDSRRSNPRACVSAVPRRYTR